jgi:hypothetical protein
MFVILNFLTVLWLQENYWLNDVDPIILSVLTEIVCSKPETPEQHTNSGPVLYY